MSKNLQKQKDLEDIPLPNYWKNSQQLLCKFKTPLTRNQTAKTRLTQPLGPTPGSPKPRILMAPGAT